MITAHRRAGCRFIKVPRTDILSRYDNCPS